MATSFLRNTIPVCHRGNTDHNACRRNNTLSSCNDKQGQYSLFLQNFVIWLYENFCNSAIKGPRLSTRNAPETICRPGSAQTCWGSSLDALALLGEGTPGTGKRERKGMEGKGDKERRERGKDGRESNSISVLLSSYFQPCYLVNTDASTLQHYTHIERHISHRTNNVRRLWLTWSILHQSHKNHCTTKS